MQSTFWESMGPVLAVVGPLVGVPLTLITFYLRSLREQQISWHADLSRRLTALEAAIAELRRHVDEFERDYTTKEEWLRECMHARRVLEQLTERTARLDALRSADHKDSNSCARPSRDRQGAESVPRVETSGQTEARP